MKRNIIIILLTIQYCSINAQDSAGIRFYQHLSWGDVLKKAKAEHKYIFVDCYASWCAPCKAMDKQVYPLKTVGDVYNRDFIAVRIQMDKTAGDNEDVMALYGTVAMLSTNYTVNSYPTFLFFDLDGKIVHKVSGSMNSTAFIQLAQDARTPEKQYYNILKDFRWGKLDTAEEKGLVKTFRNSDKTLADRIGQDYLSRTMAGSPVSKDKLVLMAELQDDPEILAFAVRYLQQLNKGDLAKKLNLNFMSDLGKKPEVKAIALSYIKNLTAVEFRQKDNLAFIERFQDLPEVRTLATRYIDRLSDNELYTKDNLQFIAAFTDTVAGRGFDVFYNHAAQVDVVLGKSAAEGNVEWVIRDDFFIPLYHKAQETGQTPDFDRIAETVNKLYGDFYGNWLAMDARLTWYKYVVNTKKDSSYWPELIRARTAEILFFRYDTVASQGSFINSSVYLEYFQHSDDPEEIQKAVNWMKNVVAKTPDKFEYLDTYADILYKSGDAQNALLWEEKAKKGGLVA